MFMQTVALYSLSRYGKKNFYRKFMLDHKELSDQLVSTYDQMIDAFDMSLVCLIEDRFSFEYDITTK